MHNKIRPKRRIHGSSAILLPFTADGRIAFDDLASHVKRTADAGLRPAVNMDTGYVNLLTDEERRAVLKTTRDVLGPGGEFVAGAFIEGKTGDPVTLYRREIEQVREFGGTPIIFQSTPMKGLSSDALVQLYRDVARDNGPLYAFELGEMFAPFGAIWDEATAQGIMEIPEIIGYKHSSLDREIEWSRLALRDRIRPDFLILTGNDLAIDMVMYGSDYLLGLSTFDPEAFALRDRYWAEGDPRFYRLNDLLQYLGALAFRAPTPAYKHSAAQYLHLGGYIGTNTPHPNAPKRPESDIEILKLIQEDIDKMVRA